MSECLHKMYRNDANSTASGYDDPMSVIRLQHEDHWLRDSTGNHAHHAYRQAWLSAAREAGTLDDSHLKGGK